MYHCGLRKGKRKTTVVLVMTKEKMPYLWRYLGPRAITKAEAKRRKAKILAMVNEVFHTEFTTLLVE